MMSTSGSSTRFRVELPSLKTGNPFGQVAETLTGKSWKLLLAGNTISCSKTTLYMVSLFYISKNMRSDYYETTKTTKRRFFELREADIIESPKP
jgi:hypothetical protein